MGLSVKFAGLDLKSPVIVSSGPHTANERVIRKAAEMGPGAIVTKSNLLEEDIVKQLQSKPGAAGEWGCARPKFARAGTASYIHCDSSDFFSSEEWAERIKRLKKELTVPIIASQWATTIDKQVRTAKLFEDAGADALEIDFCPHGFATETETMSAKTSRDVNLIKELIKRVKGAVSFPVGIKGSPDPLFPDAFAKSALEGGADFVHVEMLPLAAPDIDVETGKPVLPMLGGVFGPLRKQMTLRNVCASAKAIGYSKTHITSSGGIMNWRDALEYIMYGATTIQLCAVIHRRGYKAIKEINDGLLQYMERHGLERITDVRGIAHKYLLSSPAPMREMWLETKGKIIAEVDEERCNLCGICVDTCFREEAMQIKQDRLFIDKDKCEGCGLCAANCPRDAIKILNVDMYFERI